MLVCVTWCVGGFVCIKERLLLDFRWLIYVYVLISVHRVWVFIRMHLCACLLACIFVVRSGA